MSPTPRILLIDNDRAWLDALGEYLEKKGFAVEATDDQDRGLGLLQANGIALALIDVHMPGRDGFEFLHQLRRRGLGVSVLLVSSDDEPATAARARAEGAQGFLSKAAPPNLLLHTVIQLANPASRGNRLPMVVRWERRLPVPRKIA